MGSCSATLATDEEKQEICKVCAKDMMNLCAEEALTKQDQVQIKAPPTLDGVKETSAKLKNMAVEAKKKQEEEGGEEEAEAEGGGGGGGIMGKIGGMFEKAADVAAGALEGASAMTTSAIAKGLNKSAEGLDKAISEVEGPMTTIGKDIIAGEEEKVLQALKEYIANAGVPNATSLCMGTETDTISKHIITDAEASAAIAAKLQPVISQKVSEHTSIKAWNKLIDTYNGTVEKMASIQEKLGMPNSVQPNPIKLDIKEYICQQATLEIGRLMGEAEAGFREKPENLGTFPPIFEKVFKKNRTEKDELYLKDYKEVTKGKK